MKRAISFKFVAAKAPVQRSLSMRTRAMTDPAARARLTTYASLAATAASAAVGGTADAATVVSTALQGKKINWNTGVGNVAATSVNITFGGLLGVNGGFIINTRALPTGSGAPFGGVVAAWQGAGNGVFLRRSFASDGNAALLAPYGSNGAASTGIATFANVNLGNATSDLGNSTWIGGSAATSKYLLFNFTGTGGTYSGWIEILTTTTGFDVSGKSMYSATLGRWAYDNQAGYQLNAGQINAAAVPGGAGLAALAFGAAGLRGRRRGRN